MNDAEDEAAVEAHNRREMWRDVANHLTVAVEAISQAQGSLEDLGRSSYADLLDEHRDALRRAATEASDEAGR
jgi:hypothetical protein